jgi:type IV secretory pathway protease TraF
MQPSASQSPPSRVGRRRAAHSAIAALVGCGLAAILINTWIVEGLFVPLAVCGGSMSPGLLGACREWRCEACGEKFACNLESLPDAGRPVTCPRCGAANDPARGVEMPGQRVLVDRSAFFWRPPRRWETVVVRSPESPDTLCVKRVVGLPGERVEIADGNVLVNGEVARKDLAAVRAMAVRVSGPEATDRWRAERGTWRLEDGWFVHDASEDDSIHWLSYHHREYAVRGTRETGQAILDSSALDQNESRLLNEVDDVMLRCEIAAAGNGEIHVRARQRGDAFDVTLDAASRELTLEHNGRTARRIAAADLPKLLERPVQLEFVVADRRVQFALGGRLLVQYDYEPGVWAGEGKHVLALGANGGPIRARKLEVLRDVYYTREARTRGTQYRLGKQEYFLLGDNSPHSLDSRDWSPRGGVPADLLLGPVVVW